MSSNKGEDAVDPREDHTGDHERHTVVLWSSSDGRCFEPVVCMKAKNRDGKLLRDIDLKRIPKGIAVQFSPKGSFDEEATITMCANGGTSEPYVSLLTYALPTLFFFNPREMFLGV